MNRWLPLHGEPRRRSTHERCFGLGDRVEDSQGKIALIVRQTLRLLMIGNVLKCRCAAPGCSTQNASLRIRRGRPLRREASRQKDSMNQFPLV